MSDEHAARIAQFTELKARFPNMPQPRWSLATAYEEAERFEEAAAELRALVALQDDYCVAWLHLGSCLIELEDYEDAIAALEKARELAIAQNHVPPRQEAEMLLEQARDELD